MAKLFTLDPHDIGWVNGIRWAIASPFNPAIYFTASWAEEGWRRIGLRAVYFDGPHWQVEAWWFHIEWGQSK